MLKVRDVTISESYRGSGFACVVDFQIGPQSYNNVKVELLPEMAREVVELAIAKATGMLAADIGEIRIAGEPLPSVEADPAFVEVAPAQGCSPRNRRSAARRVGR